METPTAIKARRATLLGTIKNMAAQDAQGRWIKAGKVKKASVGDDGYLDSGLFIENLRALTANAHGNETAY